jgi:hypothetical protein
MLTVTAVFANITLVFGLASDLAGMLRYCLLDNNWWRTGGKLMDNTYFLSLRYAQVDEFFIV